MLKPVVMKKTRNSPTWNHSRPLYQTYAGTAVTVSNKVPSRNRLLGQLSDLQSRGNMGKVYWVNGGKEVVDAVQAGKVGAKAILEYLLI